MAIVLSRSEKMGFIAGPMVAVVLSYLLQVISMTMVGHLGELALSSTAIAISLSSVTGFSLILGMASALETLCGQAYGAKQYQKLGIQTQTAIFCSILVCIPLSVIWINMGKILVFIGQDLQFHMKLYSSACAKTRAQISMELFHGIGEFFRFAIPSAVMICLEWWSFELLVLLSGLLPNPELETSVLSVCLTTISTLYAIPYGFGAAVRSRKLTTSTFCCLCCVVSCNSGDYYRVARGCGWQHVGAFINLAAFYLCGIPVAAILGFWVKLGGMGLWIGILVGAFTQTILLAAVTSCLDWERQVGMASALETLCGQAYGAEQYRKLGTQTYSAIFSLILVALAVSLLWFNMEKLLILLGQDPLIAHEAGKFTSLLVPALFAYAIFQPLTRYYQTQSLTIPMLISCCITLCLHVPLCWILVFKSGLKNLGGALAISISHWLNVIFLASYMKFSSACAKTRVPISMELFQGVGEFFRSPSLLLLQWWSYEFVILLSGLLPNPQLETSVLSICLTTIATLYSFPYGLSAGVSTRVSNELGAGKPQVARKAVWCMMFITAAELILVSGTLFASRHIFGYTFSSEKEVVDSVSSMAPLVCLSVIIDGLQGVFSGVARGCGWQHIGAYINLAALYLCGVPAAATLGFLFQLKGRGLWIGISIGALLQAVLLSLVIIYTDWEKQYKEQNGEANSTGRAGEEKTQRISWRGLIEEVKRMAYIAGPMVVVNLSHYFLQIISIMMVGHLGQLFLSSTAIAMSFSVVTGFSLTLCKNSRLSVHGVIPRNWRVFRLAVPSATMICLGWWSFEFLTMLSGILPNPRLEMSVLSVCLSTISTLYTIPDGIGAAASTRVSNELGAGNARAAYVAVWCAMFVTTTQSIIVSSILFATRHVFGYVFSNEKQVVDYVTAMAPLVCISVILGSLDETLSGIAMGCGWQKYGAYVNLVAFYICGIPVAAMLGFWLKMEEKAFGLEY
ncbi:hypothetical protein GH714_041148 [Hevea brasiliensis]|uniref:Protein DETOXIFICATION n=1 Tax=Hevea brasiliensis TaxID=3981 RepID=A0A6A6N065_HEVBR|nr:hypothetical protein GH714_041148 [Hevea brasiliensis]